MKKVRLTKILSIFLLSVVVLSCKKGDKAEDEPQKDDETENTNTDKTAPAITLATSSASYVLAGSKIALAAAATDDVAVTKVEFYKGTEKLGEDTTEPYGFEYQPASSEAVLGNTISGFTAKAYDAAGNVKASDALSVSVAIRVEMESGTFVAGKAGQTADDAACSGGKRVRGMDNPGSGIDVPVSIPANGKYVIDIAGATGFDGPNGALVSINGNAATQKTVLFPKNGWNGFTLKSAEYDLIKGDLIVNFRKESDATTGWADYDYFNIYKK